jgi:hypothetical protein
MNIEELNKQQLKSKGVKSGGRSPATIKSVGDLKTAYSWDGTPLKRVEHIYVEGTGLVKCMNTELHFIFDVPKEQKGWGLWCTCGSIAGVVDYTAYSKFASPGSQVIACIRLLSTKGNTGIGEHADGSHE